LEGQPLFQVVRDVTLLPEDEQEKLADIVGAGIPVRAVVYSDLLLSGRFGRSRVILTDGDIISAPDSERAVRFPLESIALVSCREFVGNGVLEARQKDDKRRELARFSRTYGEAFQEFAREANRALGLSDTELRASEEEGSLGTKDGDRTYRCPNCGHPLSYASDNCPNCASKRQVMGRLMGFMSAHRTAFWLSIALTIVVVGINLVPAYLVRHLVDDVLEADAAPPVRMQRLYVLVGIFLGLIIIRFFTQYARTRLMGLLAANVVLELRRRLYRALQRLSLSYYDREHTGRIMARVLNDTQGIQQFVVDGVQNIIMNGLMVIAIPVLLFVENWRLAALALAPVPIVALVGKICAKRFATVYRTLRRRFATLSAAVSESISGIRVVKSFAQEEREAYGFDIHARDVYDAQISATQTRSYFGPSVMFMMTLGTIIVWFFGGRQVIAYSVGYPDARMLSTGMLMQFIAYMNLFYQPVQMLMQLSEVFQQTAVSSERVFSIMDMPSEIADHDASVDLDKIRGRLVLEKVSFNYNEGEPVLKDINLVVEPGQMIGLVGQTGSGKSTLVSLICRFYEPTKGKISLDGVPLNDIKVKSLRGQIGMVLQDTFLFAGTIKENVRYGRPDATDEQVIEATKAANAHDFIMGLPDAYDSEVGERGVGLSGGERQRIAIARAILKDPAILILDEATSAVDTATEQSIQEAMNRLVCGRTTIAIAHRLSTLRNADRLLVMDKGEIIEEGTHEELMKRDGVYAQLCRIQADFARQVDGYDDAYAGARPEIEVDE
jgi:ATP-binding cassette subfamily B protein